MGLPIPQKVTAGEVWECLTIGTNLANQTQILNRFRFMATVNPGPTSTSTDAPQRLLDQWVIRWRAHIRPRLCTNYTVARYAVQRLEGIQPIAGSSNWRLLFDQRREQISDPAQDTGTAVGDPEMDFVTAGIYWNTAIVNANTRGMMRVSPLPDASIVGGYLAEPTRAALETAGVALQAQYNDAQENVLWIGSIFSGKLASGRSPLPTPAQMGEFAIPTTGAEVTFNIGSQNTRKARRLV